MLLLNGSAQWGAVVKGWVGKEWRAVVKGWGGQGVEKPGHGFLPVLLPDTSLAEAAFPL